MRKTKSFIHLIIQFKLKQTNLKCSVYYKIKPTKKVNAFDGKDNK